MAVQDPRHPHHRRAQLDPQGQQVFPNTFLPGVFRTSQNELPLAPLSTRPCALTPSTTPDRTRPGRIL